MPTTAYTFSSSEFDIQWMSPYVSQSLDRAFGAVTPNGIYRGFRLGTSGTNLHVSVNVDPVTEDQVAVYKTADEYAVVVHTDSGNLDVDLSAYVSTTVVIVILATYATSAATTAIIQIMSLTEYLAAPNIAQLVALGQVVVPASGLIPLANITSTYRKSAWEGIPGEENAFCPLIPNSNFGLGPLGDIDPNATQALPNWTFFSTEDSTSKWTVIGTSSAGPPAVEPFGRRCVQLTAVSGGTVNAQVYITANDLLVPVFPGQRFKVSFDYKPVVGNTGNPLFLEIGFANEEEPSPSLSVIDSASVPMSTSSGSWLHFEQIMDVPSDGSAGMIVSFSLTSKTLDMTFTAGGSGVPLVLFDNLQIFLESNVHQPLAYDQLAYAIRRFGGTIWRDTVYDQNQADPPSLGDATEALLAYVNNDINAQPSLRLQRSDQQTAFGDQQPGMNVFGALLLGYGLSQALDITTPRQIVFGSLAPTTFPVVLRSLVWQGSTQIATNFRIYLSRNDYLTGQGQLEIVINASWDNTGQLWTADDATLPSQILMLGQFGITNNYYDGDQTVPFAVYTRQAASAPWAELGWTSTSANIWTALRPEVAPSDSVSVLGVGSGSLSTPSCTPPSYAGLVVQGAYDTPDRPGAFLTLESSNWPASVGGSAANTLYSKSMPKAWARMVTDGGGFVAFVDSFGFTGSTAIMGTNEINIDLDVAADNASHVAAWGGGFSPGGVPVQFALVSNGVSSLTFRAVTSTGSAIDLTGVIVTLYILVFDVQT